MTQDDDAIHVPDDADLGSPALAAALASGDAEAIGRALRHDVVVIPLLRTPDGELQIRVFEFADEPPALMLFSSVHALRAFLADEPQGRFDVQRGTVLRDFLREHRATIAHVMFDRAGPHPVGAPTDAVLAALEPRPDDDLVRWIASS
ncbi:hypothetical protein [Microbacterium sp. USHLN186]|uniref:hypothetical protein n=1 Tax=Microbacterium sp. USHLN186 TaxID=3081286 RepID=UPI00301A68AB